MVIEDSLRAADLQLAVDLYLECAYPPSSRPKSPLAGVPEDGGECLSRFDDESEGAGLDRARRYSLRLGNPHYRSMKLCLEEYILPGSLYFRVDTHDQVPALPGTPEFAKVEAIRRRNLEVRLAVEESWEAHSLPTAKGLLAQIEERPARDRGPRAPLCLIVDDEEPLARATELFLVREGYRVERAVDGEEGIAKARSISPDIVLLDYMMPYRTGHEVCCALREDPTTRRTPILLTTSTPLDLRRLSMADDYLMKPLLGRSLLVRMSRLLEFPSRFG